MRAVAFIIGCLACMYCPGHGGEVLTEPVCPVAVEVPPKPRLVVFRSEHPGQAERLWLDALAPGGAAHAVVHESVREIETVILPTVPSVEDWREGGPLFLSAMQGVRVLPTIVFFDSKGRVFDVMTGGVDPAGLQAKAERVVQKARAVRPLTLVNRITHGENSQEEQAAICRALESVPHETWFRDYPQTMKRLERLGCSLPVFVEARVLAVRLQKDRETAALMRQSFLAHDPRALRECIVSWLSKVEEARTPVAERQLILLAVVHPLWVRLEKVLYQDAHNQESEEAFTQAIAVLGEVRDLDPSSVCGRRAHQLREELRKARLAAARYD